MINDVCIIEDSLVERKILQSILIGPNFKFFAEPIKFLEYLYNKPNIDLIITDNILPKITGIELSKIIRTEYKLFFIPIVLLSNSEFTIQNDLYQYINSFILKPSTISEYKIILDHTITYWTTINRKL
jgi:CheY-like chemotaxis protein